MAITELRSGPTWMLNLSNFKTKMQNTLKIPKFQNTLKIPKYVKIFNFFPNFPNFGAKFSHVFWGFQSFCTDFSERAWKMLKNAAFAVKIGVDTADILAFWAWNEFWYFDCILVFWPSANSKRKCKHFALTLSTQKRLSARYTTIVHVHFKTSWLRICRA